MMSTLLTFSVGKAMAQTTANGPYYAWPSWDQQLPAAGNHHRMVPTSAVNQDLARSNLRPRLRRITNLIRSDTFERAKQRHPSGWMPRVKIQIRECAFMPSRLGRSSLETRLIQ